MADDVLDRAAVVELLGDYWPQWKLTDAQLASWMKALRGKRPELVKYAVEQAWRDGVYPDERFRKVIGFMNSERTSAPRPGKVRITEKCLDPAAEAWTAKQSLDAAFANVDNRSNCYGPLGSVTAAIYWEWQYWLAVAGIRHGVMPPAFPFAGRRLAYIEAYLALIRQAGVSDAEIQQHIANLTAREKAERVEMENERKNHGRFGDSSLADSIERITKAHNEKLMMAGAA